MTVAAGSPPRMRGKLNVMVFTEGTDRITPADAGKTLEGRLKLGVFGDHPRGCGENCDIIHLYKRSVGSPPRMRGKLFQRVKVGRPERITPADAGKTGLL